MTTPGARRPLKSRNWPIIQATARALARRNVTPNAISLASICFAALAGLSLFAMPAINLFVTTLLCFLAAFFTLCRALCNLLDGIVAVEGGKGTKAGELFNDIPDRVADPMIIIGLGYATTIVGWAPIAGWCAALLAVMTAYVRTLGRSLGAPADFQGPMAKPHRMMVVMVACLLTPFETIFLPPGAIFLLALLVIIGGCVMTLWRRAQTAYLYLEGRTDV